MSYHSGIDWKTVDWTKPNCELAKTHGISRQAIGQMRKRLGVPLVRKSAKVYMSKKERLERSLQVCSKIVAWDKVGVGDYIPDWCQDNWNKLMDEARGLLGDSNKPEGT